MEIVWTWAAVTKYQRMGSLDNRHLYLTVVEAGKSRIQLLAYLLSGEGLSSWFMGGHLLATHVMTRGRGRETSCVSSFFYKDLNPVMRVHAHMTSVCAESQLWLLFLEDIIPSWGLHPHALT